MTLFKNLLTLFIAISAVSIAESLNSSHRHNLRSLSLTDESSSPLNATSQRRFIVRTNYKKSRKSLSFVKVPVPQTLVSRLFGEGKQIPPLPADPLSGVSMLVSNGPCKCTEGICGCCTGMILSTFNTKGCMNMKYVPEDFAFEFQMKMNNNVLYKNRISGRNPPPVCINPPRLPIIEVCAKFHDVYFAGRNMHVCLDVSANFEGFELFQREFNCMRMGSAGFAVLSPEDGSGLPSTSSGGLSGVEAEVDAGGVDEDYDENVRSLSNFTSTEW